MSKGFYFIGKVCETCGININKEVFVNDTIEGIPLYLKIKNALMKDIQQGSYTTGLRLPSEQELGEMYHASRITVRKAISELEKDGFVRKQQGKGTFVTAHQPSQVIYLDVGGFRDTFTANGGKIVNNAHSKIIKKKITLATEDIAQKLMIETGSDIIYLQRIFYTVSSAYLIDNAWFPCALYPGLYDLIQDDVSTFFLIHQHYHYHFRKVYKELTAALTTKSESELLGCPLGSALFCTKKVIWGEQGFPIHYSKFLTRSDNVIYTSTYEEPIQTNS